MKRILCLIAMNTKLCICIVILSSVILWACSDTKGEEINDNHVVTVCFEHYAPSRYFTPGGMSHIPMHKVEYMNEHGIYTRYTPDTLHDTLVLACTDGIAELKLSYRDFEYQYFLLQQGDTVSVSLDSLDFPIVRSKHFPGCDSIYNMNYRLRRGRTFCNLEAKTCLGSSFRHIAANINYLRKIQAESLIKDYCPLDSLEHWWDSYRKEYQVTIDSFLQEGKIDSALHRRYGYLLLLKMHESNRREGIERYSDYYRIMEDGITDDNMAYPSYREYLGYYLDFLCFDKAIKLFRGVQSNTVDWRQVFDTIAAKPFQSQSKRLLLKTCMENLGDAFPGNDVGRYLNRYLLLTNDTAFCQRMLQRYNLAINSDLLLLQDADGRKMTFEEVMKRNKGKVVYVDIWASWCMPCRAEMPYAVRLREQYKGEDVVFVYLAYNDKWEDWLKACAEEDLSLLANNYFIVNSKNCKMLEQIKLKLIPRYLIFDKKGKLTELNAVRPSNELIKEMLDNYLEE